MRVAWPSSPPRLLSTASVRALHRRNKERRPWCGVSACPRTAETCGCTPALVDALVFSLSSLSCAASSPGQSFSGLCTETGRRTTPLDLVQHLPGTIDKYDTAMKHGARSLMRAALCLFSGDSDMARRQTTVPTVRL